MKTNYWYNNLQGMNCRQPADKIRQSDSPLLLNISLTQPGAWKKRRGSKLIGASEAGSGIQGAATYIKSDNTEEIRIIRDGDIEVFDGSSFSVTAAGAFATGSKVISANFKNRVYHISDGATDYLKYETGGSTTDVGSGADRISGQTLAVAQNTLFVVKDDTVYYSLFDTANNEPGDQLWEDSEGSLSASTRFFKRPGYVTAAFSYGVADRAFFFTKRDCVSFDVAVADNAYGPENVFNIGCAGPRAVTECNSYMIWMDPKGKIWGWGGAGPAIPFSWDIDDDEGDSLVAAIDKTDLENVVAGSDGNEFFFDVGDIVYREKIIPRARIKGLITQNLQRILWSVDSYPYRASVFINGNIGEGEVAYYGASGINNLYQLDTGLNDDTSAIPAYCQTRYENLENPFSKKLWKYLPVRYKPSSNTDPTFLYARYATELNTFYTTLSDPASIDNGRYINSFQKDSSVGNQFSQLELPDETRSTCISYELGNNQPDESFTIYSIGFSVTDTQDLDIQPDDRRRL